jgi:hypothetical protein
MEQTVLRMDVLIRSSNAIPCSAGPLAARLRAPTGWPQKAMAARCPGPRPGLEQRRRSRQFSMYPLTQPVRAQPPCQVKMGGPNVMSGAADAETRPVTTCSTDLAIAITSDRIQHCEHRDQKRTAHCHDRSLVEPASIKKDQTRSASLIATHRSEHAPDVMTVD